MKKNNKLILKNLNFIMSTIKGQATQWQRPIVGTFVGSVNAPFKILISTVLSLRTKDKTTAEASGRIFDLADTPDEMLKLSRSKIERAIYPVGFFRTKAKHILEICRKLTKDFKGAVPGDMSDLLSLPGVGRKTANLVLTVAYDKSGICVDTHVHRICNRWGLVCTKNPDETEMVLRRILPQDHWIGFNDALVSFGQNLCVPVSPFCNQCKISVFCPRIGVKSHR